MMLKLLGAVLAAVLATTTLSAAPAQAAKVKISKVRYDGTGDDTGTNSSINREWIRIKNTGNKRKNLAGWRIKDRTGFTFVFPDGYKLKPGKSVTVHTGAGTDTRRELYWGQDAYVWNNTGDKARLQKRTGRTVDRCKWGDGLGTINCL